MYHKKNIHAACVRLPDGSLLTQADLPPADTTRWVASRKLLVVRGVLYNLISQEEVLERYNLSAEEFMSWVHSYKVDGISGLKIRSQNNNKLKNNGKL